MKKWEKIKYPLFISLTVAVFAFIRYAYYALPSWIPVMMLSPLMFIRIVSESIFDSSLGFDILFWLVALGCVILAAPTPWERGKLRRFLLRPLIAAVVILGLSTGGILLNDPLEDTLYDIERNASHRQIQKFIDTADEAVWYAPHCYSGYTEDFPELVRPIWAGNQIPHVTDTILIDYDSKTVGFAYHHITYFVLKDIRLGKSFTVPENWDERNTVTLAEPGAVLTMYYSYRDGHPGNGCDITCIALTMADGSSYGTNQLTDPETGRNYFLKLPTSDDVFERIEDFMERKND
jgi:hypothetical protein